MDNPQVLIFFKCACGEANDKMKPDGFCGKTLKYRLRFNVKTPLNSSCKVAWFDWTVILEFLGAKNNTQLKELVFHLVGSTYLLYEGEILSVKSERIKHPRCVEAAI